MICASTVRPRAFLALSMAAMAAAGAIRCDLRALAAPRQQSTLASSDGLIQRFLLRTDEPLRSYRALRRLEAHNKRHDKHGWLEAWTTLDPETGFSFEIAGAGGSSYVRDKVLRKALEREAEAFTRSELGRAALIPANYTFVEPGSLIPQDGLLSVLVEPRRKDSVLVRGRIFLTPDGADLVRIEGQLAKPPSFWTRRVDVVRRYERIDNVRVPVALESEAQILVAGRSSFRMIYEYATINGREIGQPQPRPSEVALTADR